MQKVHHSNFFKGRFILLLITNILNYSIFAAGFYSYYTGGTDFGTFLLAILMANAVLHAVFYILMKARKNTPPFNNILTTLLFQLVHKETVCLEATIFGILALIVWGISSYFFLNYLTMWTVSLQNGVSLITKFLICSWRQRNRDNKTPIVLCCVFMIVTIFGTCWVQQLCFLLLCFCSIWMTILPLPRKTKSQCFDHWSKFDELLMTCKN